MPADDTLTNWAIRILAVAGIYYATAGLGLSDPADVSSSITTIWIPAGIAVAATMLFGWPILIGVFLGALSSNATMGDASLPAAGMIGLGNTGEAATVVLLLSLFGVKIVGQDFDGRTFAQLAFAGALGCMVAAAVGTHALLITGALPAYDYAEAWRLWWAGDTLGVSLVVPAIMLFAHPTRNVP